MKRIVVQVVRYGMVYATTGVVGLGVMAWFAYRNRHFQVTGELTQAAEEPSMLTAA